MGWVEDGVLELEFLLVPTAAFKLVVARREVANVKLVVSPGPTDGCIIALDGYSAMTCLII